VLLLAKNAVLATSKSEVVLVAVKHVVPHHAYRVNIITVLFVLLELLLDALLVPLVLVNSITMKLLAVPLLIEHAQLVLPALQENIKQLNALHP